MANEADVLYFRVAVDYVFVDLFGKVPALDIQIHIGLGLVCPREHEQLFMRAQLRRKSLSDQPQIVAGAIESVHKDDQMPVGVCCRPLVY